MSKYSNVSKVSKQGAVDSKYFGNLDRFEKDVTEKMNNTKEFKSAIRELVLQDPNIIEQRYHDVISVLLDLKEEFNI